MVKSFLLLWKNIFNYTGRCGRKDYWLGLIANVIFMYIAAIPYALITAFLGVPLPVMVTLFLIIIHLPALSAYVRRANDINMKLGDMLLVGLAVPLIGAIIVGMIGSLANDGKKYPFAWLLRMILIGMGMFFYGGLLGIVVFGTPEAFLPVVATGLGIMTVCIITGFIKVVRK